MTSPTSPTASQESCEVPSDGMPLGSSVLYLFPYFHSYADNINLDQKLRMINLFYRYYLYVFNLETQHNHSSIVPVTPYVEYINLILPPPARVEREFSSPSKQKPKQRATPLTSFHTFFSL
jgi:hypothetical protein